MFCVLPGAEDVLASFWLLHSRLISEDLPTLLRPIKAYSGLSGLGHLSNDGLEIRYAAFRIIMLQSKQKRRLFKAGAWDYLWLKKIFVYAIKIFPFISGGIGKPITCNMVGAISPSLPG